MVCKYNRGYLDHDFIVITWIIYMKGCIMTNIIFISTTKIESKLDDFNES